MNSYGDIDNFKIIKRLSVLGLVLSVVFCNQLCAFPCYFKLLEIIL